MCHATDTFGFNSIKGRVQCQWVRHGSALNHRQVEEPLTLTSINNMQRMKGLDFSLLGYGYTIKAAICNLTG